MMLRAMLFLMLLAPGLALAQGTHDHRHGASTPGPAPQPVQPGQAAFAAIQEIVALLEADPTTDWAKVDIEALRRHLIDMDAVTLHAAVSSEAVEGGLRFTVNGEGPVRDSIRRMVAAHAAAMSGAWRFTAAETPAGATLTVLVPEADRAKLRGLGFLGVMTRGMHHQAHHLMLARGGDPHRH
jgi:hypothetical protein